MGHGVYVDTQIFSNVFNRNCCYKFTVNFPVLFNFIILPKVRIPLYFDFLYSVDFTSAHISQAKHRR